MKHYPQICQHCMRDMGAPLRICPHCQHEQDGAEENESNCLQRGTLLKGHYLIGRVLGQGGFGITYLGLETRKKIRIAVKEYYPVGWSTRDCRHSGNMVQTVMDPQSVQLYQRGMQRFEREAKLLASFNKLPGIVTAYSFFYDNGTAYLIMEYCEGMSLKQYLKWYRTQNRNNPGHHPLNYEVTLGILKPVIESLDKVHRTGVVHRDISPDNLIVNRSGQVSLIDFGAARQQTAKTEQNMSTTIMVKHGYAPEEQYRSSGILGPWTDVYALCATMYRLISGVRPAEATARLHKDTLTPLKKLDLAVKVPTKVSNVIMKGLSVHQEDRYQSMAELDAALEKAFPKLKSERVPAAGQPPEEVRAVPGNGSYHTKNLTDHPTDTSWEGPEGTTVAPGRNRKPFLITGIVIGILIAALVAGILFFRMNQEENNAGAGTSSGLSSLINSSQVTPAAGGQSVFNFDSQGE